MLAHELAVAIKRSLLSRYVIAKKAKVDQAAISRFMAGKGGLSLDAAGRIADVLKLSLLPTKLREQNHELTMESIKTTVANNSTSLDKLRMQTKSRQPVPRARRPGEMSIKIHGESE